jgi:hypothetical protein
VLTCLAGMRTRPLHTLVPRQGELNLNFQHTIEPRYELKEVREGEGAMVMNSVHRSLARKLERHHATIELPRLAWAQKARETRALFSRYGSFPGKTA